MNKSISRHIKDSVKLFLRHPTTIIKTYHILSIYLTIIDSKRKKTTNTKPPRPDRLSLKGQDEGSLK